MSSELDALLWGMLDALDENDPQMFERLNKEILDRRDSELRTIRGEGPETMSVLDSSERATTGDEDDDKALANMNIKRSFPELMTFQEMHVHIMGLTSAKILAKWQHAVDLWNKREEVAFRLWSKKPLLDRNKINLWYHMFVFDVLFFNGQLHRWIRIEWDEKINGEGECAAKQNRKARIKIFPQKLPNGEYDYSAIIDTLFHEMLHAMDSLVMPEGSTDPSERVHILGFTGHGPAFRAMGARIQDLANELLFKREVFGQTLSPNLNLIWRSVSRTKSPGPWALDVLAYGPSHKAELQAIAEMDPSTLKGVEDWDFDEIQGKDFPSDAIAKAQT
ncbi:MAG: hypothetical protein L6R42_005022 [Xanthoria sp. 1 TBL-2021]|nr:MAG: hypothetical protein L6R42_005022 [Xanthoria sp. 1 TBL-2021]